MNHRIDLVLEQQAAHQIVVANVAFDEFGLGGDRPAKPGRQIVENEDVLPGIEEFQHHMAADIAGAARDQYAHKRPHLRRCNSALAIGNMLRDF